MAIVLPLILKSADVTQLEGDTIQFNGSTILEQFINSGVGNRRFQTYISGPGANFDTFYIQGETNSGGGVYNTILTLAPASPTQGVAGVGINLSGVTAPTATLEVGGSMKGTSLTLTTTPLAIASGGTGQTTANAALNALLPSQGGNSGKFLKTDATNTSWASIGSDISCSIKQVTNLGQTIPNVTSTGITLDTVNYDTNSFWSALNPTRITFATAGKYLVGASINMTPGTGTCTLQFKLNNSVYIALANFPPLNVFRCTASFIYNFSATDYVIFEVYQNSGGNVTTTTDAGATNNPVIFAQKIDKAG